MTTLSNTSEKIKRFGWIPATIILSILLVALIYFQFFRAKDKQPALPTVEKVQFDSFEGTTQTFNISDLELPTNYPNTLPLYKVSPTRSLLDQGSIFAIKFNLGGQPTSPQNDDTLGNGLLYSNDSATLIIYESLIVYQKYLTNNQVTTFNIPQLKTVATNLLAELRLSQDLENEPNIVFQRLIGETLGKSQEKDASHVSFHYSQKLSGVPIASNKYGAEVTLDSNGNIMQFSYRELGFSGTNESYPLITPQEGLNSLNAGQGSLIKTEGDVEGTETIKNLGIINLKKVYLSYYLPIKTPKTIQPVWVFEGESHPSDLTVITQFAVPAIAQKINNP